MSAESVCEQVGHARYAVHLFVMTPAEQFEMAELIVRYQLSLMCGRIEDAARLDPQPHPNRHHRARLDVLDEIAS